MSQEIARGNIAKLIGAIVIAAVVIGVGTYLTPWAQEYEVRTALNLTCADMMRLRLEGAMPEDTKAQLKSRLNRAEVKVKDGGMTVANKHVPGKFICEGKVVYDTSTPWIGITVLKPDIKPLKLHHVVVVKKDIADSW